MISLPVSDKRLVEIICSHILAGGLFAVDKQANILCANQSAQDILGINSESLIGKNFYDVAPLSTVTGSGLNISKHPLNDILTGKQITSTTAFFCKLAKNKHLSDQLVLKVTPLSEGGELRGAFIQLRPASRVVDLSEMKSIFIGFAAHQLKTPSGAVKGFLELLLKQGSVAFTSSQWDYIASAYYANERLIEVAKHLLDMTRLEGGLIQPKPESFSPKEVLHNKRFQYNLLAATKNIDIQIRSENVGSIICDKHLYTEIIDILLSNALRFSPSGTNVRVNIFQDKNRGFITQVQDKGPGISAEEKEKIFTGSHTSDNNNHGLGLRLAVKYLAILKGKLEFESSPQGGTIFTVTLPNTTMD